MEFIPQTIRLLIELVQSAPTWLSCVILFLSNFLEYIFPPFPGDTIVVAGGFFISRSAIPFLPSVLALTAGSVFGSWAGWGIGHYAQKNERIRKLLERFVGADNLQGIGKVYDKYGNWILLGNRFLHGIRGFIMIGAGYLNIPLRKVLIFGTLSALIWNAVLVSLGFFVSESLPALLNILETYTTFVLTAIIVAIAVFFVVRLIRARNFK